MAMVSRRNSISQQQLTRIHVISMLPVKKAFIPREAGVCLFKKPRLLYLSLPGTSLQAVFQESTFPNVARIA